MVDEKSRMILTLNNNTSVRIGEDIRIMRAPGSRKICIELPRNIRIVREKIDEKSEFATARKSKERTETGT